MKGPKALISSAIAQALAEYFVVDQNEIESNLLLDTKIVLNNVQLKPIDSTVTPINTFGNSTKVHITGVVKEVVFSWSWSVATGKSWVKDAVLTIAGAKFQAELTQDEKLHPLEQAKETGPSFGESMQKLGDEADTETAESIQKAGSFQSYILNQVKMIIDALTLNIVDTEMVVKMPAPVVQGPDGESKQQDYTISLVVGSKRLTLKSLGRQYADDQDNGMLKEEVEIHEFAVAIIETYKNDGGHVESSIEIAENGQEHKQPETEKSYSLMDPFSYGLQIHRTKGERFSSFSENLVVKGGQHLAVEKEHGISFHLDRPQLEAFGQLSGLVLAPPDESAGEKSDLDEKENTRMEVKEITPKAKGVEVVAEEAETPVVNEPSTFEITFARAAVDFMGDTVELNRTVLFYKADGTELTAKADEFNVVSPKSELTVTMRDLSSRIRPTLQMHISSIDTLYIPQVIDLKKPMDDVTIELIGQTWTVTVDSMYGSLPAPPTDEIIQNTQEEKIHGPDTTKADSPKASTFWVVPFPFSCKFNMVSIIKGDNQSTEILFRNPEVLMFPEADKSGTRLALTFESMKSKLANISKLDVYALIPAQISSNTFQDFALATEGVTVTGGYSVQDWISTFRIGGLWESAGEAGPTGPSSVVLPDAQVAPVKIKITYDALSLVKVKEASFRVKQFKGKSDTTASDLVDFYTKQCLSRVSNFLENSEVLGLNVESSLSFGLATTLSWATPMAPFIGVAAVVGVDSVRGAIDAGKRQRHADVGDRANSTDLLRGVAYSFVEATQKGQLRRGSTSGRGNALDWIVGTTDTGLEYIGENKDKLGAAGGGATGVIVGTLVGGPVGGIIGGIVGGVAAGTTVRQVDKKMKENREKKQQRHEAKRDEHKLRPGQLSLE